MSIIKITEAMIGTPWRGDVREFLAGVIEIIERDYIVQPRCLEQLSPELRCNMPAGHDIPFKQRHRVKLENGSEIYFENLVDNSTDVG